LAQYRYCFLPDALWALCEAAESVLPLNGAFAEIGVFTGETTVYINEHLRQHGELPNYYCIDTFSGFTPDDIDVETGRGKSEDLSQWFALNSKETFQRSMDLHGLNRTVVIQADAAKFDYTSLPPLSFALVDLDLYRPMQAALAGIWERMLPGGILIADDCNDDIHTWDGARQAYVEFCEKEGLPVDVRNHKLGFAHKPA
jgi:hypothetical protein